MSFGSWGFKSPLAHAVSYIYSPPRRRRRGVWLLAILSVVVVVVVLVTSLRSERRVLAGYIDAAQSSAAASAGAAEEFAALTDMLLLVERQEFITTMAGIRGAAGAASALLDGTEVPGDALDAHARLTLAHTSWVRGLELVEGSTLAAADDPADPVPAELLERAAVELAVGDRAYETAVEHLLSLEEESDVDVEVPSYPMVVFTPAGGAAGLITSARTSTGLAQRRDLAISAVGFEPRRLGETEDGAGVIPFTDRLIVNVTVTNQGNEPAVSVPVQVVLSSDRTGTSDAETVTIDRFEPAESTSVEFVFLVVPSVNYELVINAGPVEGEVDIDNNLLVAPFIVNEEG
ncbi:MAG: hypothetical protein ACR2OI_06065 [Acidimicrobiia bacterium]